MMHPASASDLPTPDDASRDVDVMIHSLGLQLIRRYLNQHHWGDESEAALAADALEPGLKLENVAAHSWHVADATLLLAPNFSDVDAHLALELAILHDKLELFTGDLDPTGIDGQGTRSHVFDPSAQRAKAELEQAALERYIGQLREPIRARQRALLVETIEARSNEARFVKAVDKLQALTFVLAKKAGMMTNEHITFSLRYSHKAVEYFPRLEIHYHILVNRMIALVADHRSISSTQLLESLPEKVCSELRNMIA
ncbi:HD domain-containing protein [Sphingomonadaceae bacterium OTU29MARTA1]|nr:HD domain-containing protein [Sphingomonadaceae bacterium OTU29MARTA1]